MEKKNVIQKKMVLIIDDDPNIVNLVQRHLENNNYNVAKAKNGVEGLKVFNEISCDLVILDVNMPRMDGYTVLQHLKTGWENGPKTKPFPNVLVFTHVEEKDDYGLAKNLGASAFLNKPLNKEKLIETVKKLIN